MFEHNFFFLIFSNQVKAQWVQTGDIQGAYPTCFAHHTSGILCGTNGGLYSSIDEGLSWQLSNYFINSSIIGVITKSDTIVVCFAGQTGSPFLDSAFIKTSFDGGLSWSNPAYVTENFGSISIHKFGDYILINTSEKFFRSYDNGFSWSQVILPQGQFEFNFMEYGSYALISSLDMPQTFYSYICDTSLVFQRIDINNIVNDKLMLDTLIYGFITTSPLHADIVKSSDLGQTWSIISSVDSIRGSLKLFNDTLFYEINSGLYKFSSDRGVSWSFTGRPRYVDNLFILPLLNGDEIAYGDIERTIVHYNMANDSNYISDTGTHGRGIITIVPADSVLYCVANADLYRSIDGGNNWTKRSTANVFNELFVSTDSLYTHGFGLYRSYDAGLTWSEGLSNGIFPPDIDRIGRRGNRFYATSNFSNSIWYTDDFGDNWFQLPSIPSNPCNGLSGSINKMCSVGNNLIIVSTNGVVSKLDSANTTWTHLRCIASSSGNTIYPTIQFTDNKLIVCDETNLYISLDSGSTWIIPTMIGIPFSSNGFLILPQSIVAENGQLIGQCGRYGIYTSYDNGDSWTLYDNSVLEFTPYSLAIYEHQLIAGSLFESLWKQGSILNQVSVHSQNYRPLDIFPNPSYNQFTITINDLQLKNSTLKLYDITGKKVKQMTISSKETIVLTDDLNQGIYFGSLSNQRYAAFKIIVLK